jgi:hypothetical protein
MAIIQMQSCTCFMIPYFAEPHGGKVDSPCHLKYMYFTADVFCASCSQILDHRGPFDGERKFFRIHLMDTRSVVFMLRHMVCLKIALSITTLETIRTQNDLRPVL